MKLFALLAVILWIGACVEARPNVFLRRIVRSAPDVFHDVDSGDVLVRVARQAGGGGGSGGGQGDHHDYVDFGAHTGHHGAFGWYADFPVHTQEH